MASQIRRDHRTGDDRMIHVVQIHSPGCAGATTPSCGSLPRVGPYGTGETEP